VILQALQNSAVLHCTFELHWHMLPSALCPAGTTQENRFGVVVSFAKAQCYIYSHFLDMLGHCFVIGLSI
jgi:hypothetical protein